MIITTSYKKRILIDVAIAAGITALVNIRVAHCWNQITSSPADFFICTISPQNTVCDAEDGSSRLPGVYRAASGCCTHQDIAGKRAVGDSQIFIGAGAVDCDAAAVLDPVAVKQAVCYD
jgi:pyridoxal biosynthesis lyase PdxS